MKNVVIWRFHDAAAYPAFINLHRKGLINIVAWYGDTFRCPYCTHEIYQMVKKVFLNSEYHSYDYQIYEKVYNSIFHYISMHASKPLRYYTKPIDEYVHLFNILFNHFYHLLVSNNVQIVFFSFIPHQGPEKVLYEVAKALNIKTVMVYQTIFPNKFLYLYNVEDFGDWSNLPCYQQEIIKVERTYKKDLFYMKGKKWRKINRDDWQKFIRSLSKIPMKWEKADILETAVSKLIHWKRNVLYRKTVVQYAKSVDLTRKYVYFPLHLQPELSTSALGGRYVDQILAIERLQDLIPDDWVIYVKDNPKQNSVMRSTLFFERLKAIKKAILVPTQMNTYTLLENCIFVATITGTAGWEAISGGKNVLVFGRPWYKSLPGVFTYYEGMSLQPILDYKIDHTELEKELGDLMGKMADGVTDMPYAKIVKGFDPEQNIAYLESFFKSVIYE